ncbi:MAG TPA: HAD family hydrolase [Vicinamibacterales bacterium]|nr:HAD family hydrolase [Vicinamibacterales bacterium]
MMDFTGIKGVLFDLDGTLYRQTPMRALMAAELAMLPLSGPRKAPRRLKALQAYRAAQERLRDATAAGSSASQVEAAARASGLSVAEVETLVAEWMIRRPLKYLQFCRRPGVPALLDRLSRAGIRAGILSDYPAAEKLRALGLEGRFAPVLCATDREIGAFKPSPRGFLRACDVWNLAPSEVLYVGDRIEVDAAGAAAAGMRCAIIGAARDRSGSAERFEMYPSFERLSRAFDHR